MTQLTGNACDISVDSPTGITSRLDNRLRIGTCKTTTSLFAVQRIVMPYAIEKLDSEWVVFAGGAAILRCAEADMALEITRMARDRLMGINRENTPRESRSENHTLEFRRAG